MIGTNTSFSGVYMHPGMIDLTDAGISVTTSEELRNMAEEETMNCETRFIRRRKRLMKNTHYTFHFVIP